ncbi:CidA/LrgA family holin-like protein [Bacillus sp. TL12]|uniref:CidA/LrgA family holin-like protein n=1 Tax=Bacillus sp. TL12 TaxID=2894756 RepID=UPI001F52651A|nr:CidA/LrgA family holin-like protein [Bacillus sp. TL12]MCI0765043.1 CidA/LrgA family holin-like protein [Bacillus sp. TL12]
MKFIVFSLQIGMLFMFSLAGECLQKTFSLAIPGSLLGMLMLFILLYSGIVKVRWFELGAEKLIAFLPLFLIPSTTGLMEYGSFFVSKGSIMFFIVILSTLVTLLISGYISQFLVSSKK